MRNVRLATLALAGMVPACGGGGDGGTQPPPPAVFTSLAIAPANPSLVLRDTLQMSATPRDQNGTAMTGLPLATFERVAGTGTAVSVSATGRVIADQTGSAQIRASLTSGGTTHTATASATVAPLATTAEVSASGGGTSFNPDTVKIAVNGSVTWTFSSGASSPHNVTFDSQLAAENIDNTTTGGVTRTFATAGRFTYRCTRHPGMDGAVIVRTP